MGRTSGLPLVDRILDGKLEQILREKRAAGESYETIGRWLATEHDITATKDTVRRWCLGLSIEAAPTSEPAA